MTYDALMDQAARRLAGSEIEAPRREARLLMALAAGMQTAELIAKGREAVPGPVAARFEEYVHRREGRQPFAHIAGYRSFYGLDFICDPRALVPRPDSEIIVETALKLMPRGRGVKIADLGTGSGCLLIALLHQRGGVQGVGVERDPGAAALARENAKRHGVEARAEIACLAWRDWKGWAQADLIVSNPPYIPSYEIDQLQPEVFLHDPRTALDGGDDGLQAYREIISLAAKKMKQGAWLLFEIGYDQRESVWALMQEAGFTDLGSARDLGGNDRAVWCKNIAAQR